VNVIVAHSFTRKHFDWIAELHVVALGAIRAALCSLGEQTLLTNSFCCNKVETLMI
jgi:hypothetical protein